MIAIAAVDENFAIGKDNALLAKIPMDLKRFSEITTGNTLIMGRKTFESIPNPPLKNRETILLTKTPQKYPKIKSATSLEELFALIKNIKGEIYVAGGEAVYNQLLPYCEKALITKIQHNFKADTWFPNLDKLSSWEITEKTDYIRTSTYSVAFVDYVNREPRR